MKPFGLAHLATGLLVISTATAAANPPTAKPNLLVILADDLGYGDLQCYNPQRGKIPTPHLDTLAAQGMRFTDAHSSSGVCSPSRYTLLTGRYHWRTRLQRGIVQLWEQPLIAPGRLTVADLAKQHGYRTACIGKWHLGWHWPIPAPHRPHFTGFGGQAGGGGANLITQATDAQRAAWREVFSLPIGGGPLAAGFDTYFGTDVPNWPPYCFIENDRCVGIPTALLPADELRRNQASIQGPALPDWQLEPILPTLRDRACAFLTNTAPRPEPFLLYLPLTTPHTPLAVNREWQGRSGLDNDAADLIMETDAAVGKVLTALHQSGAADRTLVLFTSDNGFAPYVGARELEARGHFPSGPLRGYKSDVWEGGHRVPFLVRWSKVVKPGSVCTQLVHQADLIATFADLLGVQLPAAAGEDSFSLLPLLLGQNQPTRPQAVSCAANGVPSLRQGPWKLVLAPDAQTGTAAHLYNLATDLGETTNLAAAQPQRVATLTALLEELIQNGRSTPGPAQTNDAPLQRFAPPTAALPNSHPAER
ncbi:MAG: arylsulfatase [Verrucomicrobia bacterium]|nr:arylsulfatase [Verrucomicrobiota bacterium]